MKREENKKKKPLTRLILLGGKGEIFELRCCAGCSGTASHRRSTLSFSLRENEEFKPQRFPVKYRRSPIGASSVFGGKGEILNSGAAPDAAGLLHTAAAPCHFRCAKMRSSNRSAFP